MVDPGNVPKNDPEMNPEMDPIIAESVPETYVSLYFRESGLPEGIWGKLWDHFRVPLFLQVAIPLLGSLICQDRFLNRILKVAFRSYYFASFWLFKKMTPLRCPIWPHPTTLWSKSSKRPQMTIFRFAHLNH